MGIGCVTTSQTVGMAALLAAAWHVPQLRVWVHGRVGKGATLELDRVRLGFPSELSPVPGGDTLVEDHPPLGLWSWQVLQRFADRQRRANLSTYVILTPHRETPIAAFLECLVRTRGTLGHRVVTGAIPNPLFEPQSRRDGSSD